MVQSLLWNPGSFSGIHFMLLGGNGVRLGEKNGSLLSPLPGRDCSHLPWALEMSPCQLHCLF